MNTKSSRGQALTETLVSMLALVPVFVLLPYVGKYLDVKDKAATFARYITWERTILSDPGADWGAGENQLGDALMSREAATRVLGRPRQQFLSSIDDFTVEGITRNPLWVDYRGNDLVSLEGFRRLASDPEQNRPDPVSADAGSLLEEVETPQLRGFSVEELAYGDGVLGLDLNANGFAAGQVNLPVVPMPTFERRGVAIDIVFPKDDAERLIFTQEAGVLTDAWVPGSEDNFNDRVGGLVTADLLQLIVLPGTETFGNTPLFKEGAAGQDPQLESDTRVYPSQYIAPGPVLLL